MRHAKLLPLFLLGLGLIFAATKSAATTDETLAAFEALIQEHPPGSAKDMGAVPYLTWVDTHRQKVTAAGRAYLAAHPEDPRRWDVVLKMAGMRPYFAKSYGPDVEARGPGAAVIDEAARNAWDEEMTSLKQQLMDSADAAPAAREAVEWERFGADYRAIGVAARKDGAKPDYSPLRARYLAHAAKYAELDVVASRAADYLLSLEWDQPGSSEEIWRELRGATNATLRTKAESQMEYFEKLKKPLELAFTAADGRPVDFKALRGKVVLVDFWATWCGPCIAELPNAKKVYAAYHDKGFEVVGVTLENPGFTPKDTEEEKAAKLEKAKDKMLAFTRENAMLWPQYFDGKWWKNEIAVQYAINAIPAMFLVDQNGKIVSTNARGDRLETEVKRLLKL